MLGLVVVLLLLLYIVLLHDLLRRARPPARRARPPARNAPRREPLVVPEDRNHAGRDASRVESNDAARPLSATLPAKQEKAPAVYVAGPSSSDRQKTGPSQVSTRLASQSGGASRDPDASSAKVAPTDSLSSLGTSFVNKFADLKVDTTQSRLTPPAGACHPRKQTCSPRRGHTLSLSPLSTPPCSPTPSPSPTSSRTPMGSRGRSLGGQSAVDFTLYKKKIRVLTKSPQKPQTKAAGKMRAAFAADSTTTTTWFYQLSANTELLATPPDLANHPEGLSLGDLYLDRVGGVYQLWLWRLDEIGVPHWKKVPVGYQRDDGKHLIVTAKNHLLSWVTPSYYRQVACAYDSVIGKGDD